MHTKTHTLKTYTNNDTHTHRTYTRTKGTRRTHAPHSNKTHTHIIYTQNTNTRTKETHTKTHLQRTHPLPTVSLCSHAQKRPTHTPTNTTHTHTCGKPVSCLFVFKYVCFQTYKRNTRTKDTYTYIHLLRIWLLPLCMYMCIHTTDTDSLCIHVYTHSIDMYTQWVRKSLRVYMCVPRTQRMYREASAGDSVCIRVYTHTKDTKHVSFAEYGLFYRALLQKRPKYRVKSRICNSK